MKRFFNIGKKKYSEAIDIDSSKIPKHIAIIMDGNGRWAKERNLPRTLGHKVGVETIREIVKECSSLGVNYLTLYAFSTENWKRPVDEVNALIKLLVEYLKIELEELNSNGVVVNHIGDISKFPVVCQNELINAYNKTKDNSGIVLNLALNYGGRDEIINAIINLFNEVKKGNLDIDSLNEETLSSYMNTKGMPDPDLIIRTAGEQRLSNFLLWQCAYSEFWFTDVKWPDFDKEQLMRAIHDFQKRDRRFGGIK